MSWLKNSYADDGGVEVGGIIPEVPFFHKVFGGTRHVWVCAVLLARLEEWVLRDGCTIEGGRLVPLIGA